MSDTIEPTPLADLLKKQPNDIILSIEAVISKVSKHIPADGGSFQDIVLKDGDVEVITMLNSRKAVPENFTGKRIRATCTKVERGWVGIRMMKRKNWQTNAEELILVIDQQADVRNSGESSSSEPEAAKTTPPETKLPPAQTQRRQTVAPISDGIDEVERVVNVLRKRKTLHGLCLLVAREERDEYEKLTGEVLTSEQVSGAATTIFINSERSNLSNSLPTELDQQTLRKFFPNLKK